MIRGSPEYHSTQLNPMGEKFMRNRQSSFVLAFVFIIASFFSVQAHGAVVSAAPSNYTRILSSLQPGDTLNLAAGTYTNDLYVAGLNGSSSAWITIQGPASGPPAYFLANASTNTVELVNCSFLAVKNLTLDGQNQPGPFGVSAKGGTSNLVHDILIENCTIQNYNGTQDTDGISTKTTTWNWTIRGNRIVSAGTGLYLGNSDGNDPFIAGVIENNLVQFPIGYCMEIKPQNEWPAVVGMPIGTTTTIIRNNVFIKNDSPSPSGDRPNLLVDNFPDSGTGSNNRYEVYGNFFYHNPRESLFQFSGRVTIHDNIFVDTPNNAIVAQNHQWSPTTTTTATSVVKLAYVYNNTIYSTGNGIHFSSAAAQADDVTGNLVFASTPIGGSIVNQSNNITDSVANAANYVASPSITLGSMNFYPRAGQCSGSALSVSLFTGDTDYSIDFNGTSKGSFIYRGAYSGSGTNPGWQLQAANKPLTGSILPPSITSVLSAAGTVGTTFTYNIAASNSPTSFNATGLPTGLSVNTTSGVISGTPTTSATLNVTISATNVGGTGSATLTLTINAAPAKPVITSALTATGTVGMLFSYTIAANNTPTTYGASGLPAGLSVNTATGAVSGTPTTAGASNVIISATNAVGTGSATLALTINAAPPPKPVITSALTAAGTVGKAFNYDITATNSATSYNATRLPAGLSVNTSTGAITGTPTAAGTTNVTISGTNAGGTGTATLVLTVKPLPPAITSALTATGTVGSAFSYTIAASNSPASFNATGLPAGLAVNASTGAISGTPTAAGTFNVTIGATNAAGTGTAVLVLTMNAANRPPVISSAATAVPNPATAGQSVAFTAAAADPDGDTLTYSWSFGDSATGTGASTSHSYAAAGNYTATVTVSDGHAHTISSSVAVVVNAALVAPSITTQPANQTVTAGQTATFSVEASASGALSYQWQKNGANIAGATSASCGTPATTTADSGSAFRCVVTNSAGSAISNAATLTVNAAGTYVARINFQPSTSPVPAGYQMDSGAVFNAARGYGWNVAPGYRDRGSINADARLGTFVFVWAKSSATWTYDIPNGNYLVTLASGDASYAQGPQLIAVQGNVAVNNVGTKANQFVTVTDFPVSVLAGQLTVMIGGTGSGNTILNYINIKPATASSEATVSALLSSETSAVPSVSLSAAPLPLVVKKLSCAVSFNKKGHDTAAFSGKISGLPSLAKLAGQTVQVWIGGEQAAFTLDGKGHAKSGAGALSITSSGSINVVQKGQTWSQPWPDVGIDPAATRANAKLKVNVMLSINGTFYSGEVTATYFGKPNVAGKFHN